jgi:hypothetical protein
MLPPGGVTPRARTQTDREITNEPCSSTSLLSVARCLFIYVLIATAISAACIDWKEHPTQKAFREVRGVP